MKRDEELEEYFENGFDPKKCDSGEMLEEYHKWLKTASKEKIDLYGQPSAICDQF